VSLGRDLRSGFLEVAFAHGPALPSRGSTITIGEPKLTKILQARTRFSPVLCNAVRTYATAKPGALFLFMELGGELTYCFSAPSHGFCLISNPNLLLSARCASDSPPLPSHAIPATLLQPLLRCLPSSRAGSRVLPLAVMSRRLVVS